MFNIYDGTHPSL